jgi:hypothetical protein
MDCAMIGKGCSNVEDFMIEDLSYKGDVQRSVPFEEVVIKTPLEIIEKFTVSSHCFRYISHCVFGFLSLKLNPLHRPRLPHEESFSLESPSRREAVDPTILRWNNE